MKRLSWASAGFERRRLKLNPLKLTALRRCFNGRRKRARIDSKSLACGGGESLKSFHIQRAGMLGKKAYTREIVCTGGEHCGRGLNKSLFVRDSQRQKIFAH
jgi:hypothetical protein